MKKIIAIILFALILSTFTSCSNNELTYNINDLYKVERVENFLYQYTVTDKNGNVLVTDKTNRQPHINIIDDKVLSVSIQYGTGLSTQDTTYYNVDTGEISETYTYILGEFKNNNVYGTLDNSTKTHKVITHNIFDENENYKEITLPDVKVAADFINKCIISENGIATITYLNGDNHLLTKVKFDLN